MMTDNTDHPMCYEIIVKDQLDTQWQAWFDDLVITLTQDGNTSLRGVVVDQAALYGILKRIHNLGLRLISVNLQVEE